MLHLADRLLPWFVRQNRSLPWREAPTPYHVWLSEIMLQQTRIEAVIPYYRRFLQHFPTLASLAAAEEGELMKCWEGLGYYSRARNLKKAAGVVMAQHGGELPPSLPALLSLPGIGPYTAGAIASIAFCLPTPAVDGNVLRVITRVTADDSDIALPATKERITALLGGEYPEAGPDCRAFTQALMEVGQTVCPPAGAPRCGDCPLHPLCRGAAEGAPTRYPVKAPKKERKVVKKTVLLLRAGERFALRRRPDSGLLAGLWEFPNLDRPLSPEEAQLAAEGFGLSPLGATALPTAKHIFTHLEWHMTGYLVPVEQESDAFTWAAPEEIRHVYAIASAFRAFRKVAEEG